MFIYNYEPIKLFKTKEKLGIDIGIKNYAVIASNKEQPIMFKHFKDYESYKELERKVIKLQQIIAHKVEINYGKLLNSYMDKYPNKELTEIIKNKLKGESYKTSQINRLFKKIKALKQKQTNIRQDFINKLVNFIVVRTKPREITIEDLDISKMIRHNGTKDATLHKYISESSFYTFREKIINKCIECDIKLRISNKYFASSKICSCCGSKKDNLTLNDRVYICDECGLEIDRDLNAAINLLKLKDKKCFIYA